MKDLPRIIFSVSILISLLLGPALSTCQTDPAGTSAAQTVPGLGDVTVKRIHVSDVDSTHLQVAVELTTVAPRTVTLENFRLTSLRLNGLPAFADPVAEPVSLVQGKPADLPPIFVTILFRDLTTVAPLREMLEKQTVHVQGQVVAAIKMNFAEKLMVHSEHPHASLPVSADVPVVFGVSPLQRQAALGVLSLVDFGMQGSLLAQRTIPGLQSSWVHDLEAGAGANLVVVESSYTLKQADSSYPVIVDQLGFRLASGQVITTAEAIAPWEFEPDFLAKIGAGEVKLVKNSLEIQLRPIAKPGATAPAPLLLTHKDFSLNERGGRSKDLLIMPKGKSDNFEKVNVRRRGLPDALAVFLLQAPPPSGGFAVAPAAIAQQDLWEKAAAYRLVLDQASSTQRVEVVEFQARRDGAGIHFNHPVDPAFFGSPVMVPEGVLGIVQDEQVGAFLPADLSTAPAGPPAGK
jgi:hypothetical protein